MAEIPGIQGDLANLKYLIDDPVNPQIADVQRISDALNKGIIPDVSPMKLGFRRGVESVIGTTKGAYGYLANQYSPGSGDSAYESAAVNFDRANRLALPTDDIANVGSVGDMVDWMSGGVGYLAPSIAATVAGAVGGFGVGGGIAAGGLAFGRVGAEKLAQRQIMKKLGSRLDVGPPSPRSVAAAARLRNRSIAKGRRRGALAGGAATSFPQELGEIAIGQHEEGVDAPLVALAGATAASALDILPQMRVIKGLFDGKKALPKGGLKKLAKAGKESLKQGGLESGTEGLQTVIERAASFKDIDSPEAFNEYINAAALGALGGGLIGPVPALLERQGDQFVDNRKPPAAAPIDPNVINTGELGAYKIDKVHGLEEGKSNVADVMAAIDAERDSTVVTADDLAVVREATGLAPPAAEGMTYKQLQAMLKIAKTKGKDGKLRTAKDKLTPEIRQVAEQLRLRLSEKHGKSNERVKRLTKLRDDLIVRMQAQARDNGDEALASVMDNSVLEQLAERKAIMQQRDTEEGVVAESKARLLELDAKLEKYDAAVRSARTRLEQDKFLLQTVKHMVSSTPDIDVMDTDFQNFIRVELLERGIITAKTLSKQIANATTPQELLDLANTTDNDNVAALAQALLALHIEKDHNAKSQVYQKWQQRLTESVAKKQAQYNEHSDRLNATLGQRDNLPFFLERTTLPSAFDAITDPELTPFEEAVQRDPDLPAKMRAAEDREFQELRRQAGAQFDLFGGQEALSDPESAIARETAELTANREAAWDAIDEARRKQENWMYFRREQELDAAKDLDYSRAKSGAESNKVAADWVRLADMVFDNIHTAKTQKEINALVRGMSRVLDEEKMTEVNESSQRALQFVADPDPESVQNLYRNYVRTGVHNSLSTAMSEMQVTEAQAAGLGLSPAQQQWVYNRNTDGWAVIVDKYGPMRTYEDVYKASLEVVAETNALVRNKKGAIVYNRKIRGEQRLMLNLLMHMSEVILISENRTRSTPLMNPMMYLKNVMWKKDLGKMEAAKDEFVSAFIDPNKTVVSAEDMLFEGETLDNLIEVNESDMKLLGKPVSQLRDRKTLVDGMYQTAVDSNDEAKVARLAPRKQRLDTAFNRMVSRIPSLAPDAPMRSVRSAESLDTSHGLTGEQTEQQTREAVAYMLEFRTPLLHKVLRKRWRRQQGSAIDAFGNKVFELKKDTDSEHRRNSGPFTQLTSEEKRMVRMLGFSNDQLAITVAAGDIVVELESTMDKLETAVNRGHREELTAHMRRMVEHMHNNMIASPPATSRDAVREWLQVQRPYVSAMIEAARIARNELWLRNVDMKSKEVKQLLSDAPEDALTQFKEIDSGLNVTILRDFTGPNAFGWKRDPKRVKKFTKAEQAEQRRELAARKKELQALKGDINELMAHLRPRFNTPAGKAKWKQEQAAATRKHQKLNRNEWNAMLSTYELRQDELIYIINSINKDLNNPYTITYLDQMTDEQQEAELKGNMGWVTTERNYKRQVPLSQLVSDMNTSEMFHSGTKTSIARIDGVPQQVVTDSNAEIEQRQAEEEGIVQSSGDEVLNKAMRQAALSHAFRFSDEVKSQSELDFSGEVRDDDGRSLLDDGELPSDPNTVSLDDPEAQARLNSATDDESFYRLGEGEFERTPDQKREAMLQVVTIINRILGVNIEVGDTLGAYNSLQFDPNNPANTGVSMDRVRNKKGAPVGGTYTPTDSILAVALDRAAPSSAALHEAFHYVKDRMLTPHEARMLNQAFRKGGTLYNQVIRSMEALSDFTPEHVESLSSTEAVEEIQAYAFELMHKGSLHSRGTVARTLAKIREFFNKIANALRGRGWTSDSVEVNQLFRAISRGDLANRPAQYSNIATRDMLQQAATIDPAIEQMMNTVAAAMHTAPDAVSGLVHRAGGAKNLTVEKMARGWMSTFGSMAELARQSKKAKPIIELVRKQRVAKAQVISQVDEMLTDWMKESSLGHTLTSVFKPTPHIMKVSRKLIEHTIDKQTFRHLNGTMGEQWWHQGGAYDETAMRRAGFNAKEIRMYGQMRNAMDFLIMEEHEERAKFYERLEKPTIAASIRQQGEKLVREGYVPLRRFGDFGTTIYVVDPVTGDRNAVGHQQFSTASEAEQAASQMREVLPANVEIVRGTVTKESLPMENNFTLTAFLSSLDTYGIKLTTKQHERIIKTLTDADSRMRNARLNRKEIPGWSEDLLRISSEFATHMSGSISALRYNQEINTAVAESGANWNHVDGPNGGFYRDQVMKLLSFLRNSPIAEDEYAQKFRASAAFALLGGNISAGLVQLSQMPLATVPYLSQFGGVFGSYSSVMGAFKTVADQKFANLGALRKAVNAGQGLGGLPADETAALLRAGEDGITQAAQIYAISGIANGRLLARSTRFRKLNEVWMSPFVYTEEVNRRATFIGAYRMAKAMTPAKAAEHNAKRAAKGLQTIALNPDGTVDAEAFAREAVNETQFIYDRANRPKWAREGIPSILYTFKSYPVFMLELIKNMDAKGRTTLFATLMLSSGLMGMPFADDAADIIDWLSRILGISTTHNTRKAVHDVIEAIGEGIGVADLPEYMMYGVLDPLTGIGIGSRTGLGNIIPGTDGRVEEVGGPVGSVIGGGFRTAAELAGGDIEGALKELPISGIRNLAAGIDQFQTGVATDKRHRMVGPVTPWQAMVKSIGFTPHEIQMEYHRIKLTRVSNDFVRSKRDSFVDAYIAANGDKDTQRELMQSKVSWNRAHAESPWLKIVVQPEDLRKAVAASKQPISKRSTDNLKPALRSEFKSLFESR